MAIKRTLRRHGADTNQNIFYLVIAVIVLAAAAYGLDTGIRQYRKLDAQDMIAKMSYGIRELYPTKASLPEDLAPVDIIRRTGILSEARGNFIPPNGIPTTYYGGRFATYIGNSIVRTMTQTTDHSFIIYLVWTDATSPRGHERFCRSLLAGQADAEGAEEVSFADLPFYDSGPFGSSYRIYGACSPESSIILINYVY